MGAFAPGRFICAASFLKTRMVSERSLNTICATSAHRYGGTNGRNDPDGKRTTRHSFNDDEADRYRIGHVTRDPISSPTASGLLALAQARLGRDQQQQTANEKYGDALAAGGASGLQSFGARLRAARSAHAVDNRSAEARYQLARVATEQGLATHRQGTGCWPRHEFKRPAGRSLRLTQTKEI